MRARSLGQRRLIRLALLLSLAGALTAAFTHDCASADAALLTAPASAALGQSEVGDTASGTASDSCADTWDSAPNGPAPTFTEKTFWIVLGLVVLGWLVLAADAPRDAL